MAERQCCLASSQRLRDAIDTLLNELEYDFFENKLEACMECKSGFDSAMAINLHAQLKSVYDVLQRIKVMLLSANK